MAIAESSAANKFVGVMFMNYLPMSLIIAGVVQILCQIFKFALYSIRDKQINFHYLVTAGGMPSAHSAFVSSTATAVALLDGVQTQSFSVCAVFAFIVIYDSFRLRGTVQRQSIILNKMMKSCGIADEKPLNEMVGHSIPEIAIGVITGLICTIVITKLFALSGVVQPFYEWIR